MRLAKAKVKSFENFPEQEKCCNIMKEVSKLYCNLPITIDLDNTNNYKSFVGHCGQELGYKLGVFVIEAPIDMTGYIPFEVIDIDEGEQHVN